MNVLKTSIDTRGAGIRRQSRARCGRVVEDLRQKLEMVRARRRRGRRVRHIARGKLLPRERIDALLDPGAPFLEVCQLAANGMYGDDAPGAGVVTGIGRVSAIGVHDRRQRRHGEGRNLLSADGEEASARAGNRRAEPSALHLSGRFRRRLPAATGRGISRPRSFRAHLLQSGRSCRPRVFRRSPW